ncbi:uncharacterized protein LOC142255711 [Anomaloglossus baeobatrachus]|uniref:uncharacterized protein LOC142255711 n=1 Tax=Anomaloglossus baeobatrachus TaxID=238106 RepID=UPI003F4F8670
MLKSQRYLNLWEQKVGSSSYSMSCISCFNGNVTNCSGGSISCPDSNECLSMFLKITINGSTSGNFFRSCAPKNQCNITGSSSFSGGTMEMAATCCSETDMCTPADPQLPSTNSTQPNGRVCTMCQSINSDGCDTKNTMSCDGNESMCIHFTTTTTVFQTSELAFRGCSTRSICDINQQLFKTNQLMTVYNYVCSEASSNLRFGSIILFVFSFLFNYIFYF